jgi:hypothetical protein
MRSHTRHTDAGLARPHVPRSSRTPPKRAASYSRDERAWGPRLKWEVERRKCNSGPGMASMVAHLPPHLDPTRRLFVHLLASMSSPAHAQGVPKGVSEFSTGQLILPVPPPLHCEHRRSLGHRMSNTKEGRFHLWRFAVGFKFSFLLGSFICYQRASSQIFRPPTAETALISGT